MFGIISPSFSALDNQEQSSYQAIYCNLCAALSTIFGIHARPLVLNDVVTLDWLANGNHCSDHLFKDMNCVKGGTRFKTKKSLSKRQQFLAAISAYAITIKLEDAVQDEPSLKTKLAHKFYRKVAGQAKNLLEELNFDYQKLEAMLTQQKKIEDERITDLDLASSPTSHGYGVVAAKIAELGGSEEVELAKVMGEYVGRYVFIIDAIKDLKEDVTNLNYNPFVIQGVLNESTLAKASLTKAVPYLLEQQQRLLATLLDTASRVEKTWVYINNHLKDYLQKFVVENKQVDLLKELRQFRAVNGNCFKRTGTGGPKFICHFCNKPDQGGGCGTC